MHPSFILESFLRHILALIVFLSSIAPLHSDVPEQMHYNGYLTNAVGEAVDCPDVLQCADVYNFTFRIYATSQGGVPIWEEVHDSIPLYGGSFHARLGNINPITPSLLSGTAWLALQINDNPEMGPRQKLVSAAYAIKAAQADSANEAYNAEQLGGVDAADYATQSAIANLESNLAPVATEGLPDDLADGDDDTLANMPCAPGMVAKASATGWICDVDQIGDTTDTNLTETQVDFMVSDNGYALEADLNTLQAELLNAQNTITTLQEELSNLGTTSGGQSVDITDLKASVEAAQINITNLQSALAEIEGDISNLQSVDVVLQTAISDLDASLAPIAKSGFFMDLALIPAGLEDGDNDLLGTLTCADGEVAKRSGTSWICAEDVNSIVEVTSTGLCDSASEGHMYFDVPLNALFICNGSEYKQINACTGTCDLPSTAACGLAVQDDCGNSCGTVGTGLNVTECAAPATVTCGEPIYDTCSNLCPNAGTKLEQSQCYGLDATTPCGVTVVDPCGNPCGNTGLFCDAGLVCESGACTEKPEGFAEFIAIGSHAFTVPDNVFAMTALAIGGGANGQKSGGGSAGGGGGGAKSIMAVLPGQTIILEVGRGGSLQGIYELNGGTSTVGAPFNLTAAGGTDHGVGGTGSGGNLHNTRGGTSSPGSSHADAVKIDGIPEETGDGGGAGAWLNGFGGVAVPGTGLGFGGGGGSQACNNYGGHCLGASGGENGFNGGGWGQAGGGPSGGQSGSPNPCNTYFYGGGGGSYGGGGGNDGQGSDASCLNHFLGGDGAHGYVRFEWGPSIVVE